MKTYKSNKRSLSMLSNVFLLEINNKSLKNHILTRNTKTLYHLHLLINHIYLFRNLLNHLNHLKIILKNIYLKKKPTKKPMSKLLNLLSLLNMLKLILNPLKLLSNHLKLISNLLKISSNPSSS
jgi:hypothetical protein